MLSQVVIAQVTGHNPPANVKIVFKMMGQSVAAPAVMGRDWIDPLRVRQKPLPTVGSWGIVLLPNGDIRNATWAFTLAPSQADALTYAGDPTDPFVDYSAYFSGHWTYLDGKGNSATEFADGSTLVMGATSGLPTIYRRIVNQKQEQETQEFTRAQRLPNPPSGFYANFHHISGTSFSVDPSGNFSVSGASGATITFNFGGTSFMIDVSGNAKLSLASSGLFDISQGGAAPNDFIVLVSKLVTAFNNHTHKNVTAGGANSGTPTTNIAAADIESAIVKISN